MPTTYIAPGDIKKILLEYLLGTPQLLFFAILMGVSYFSAKYNLSNKNFMLILIISSLIFAGILGEAMYILIFVIIGFVLFKGIGRFFT